MLERERVRAEAENARRENRITATLEEMEETEQRRRQLLMDELEDKNAQLYDAQKQIGELNKRLLAASPSQPSQPPPAIPSSSSLPLPEALPSPASGPPPLTASPSTVSHPRSWFRLPRLIPTRRLLIILFIFLLAFFSLYLHSPSSRPSATENTNSGQVNTEVLPLPAAEILPTSEVYEERRRQVQAWAMGNWDRNERMFRGEEPRDGDREDRPIPGEAS